MSGKPMELLRLENYSVSYDGVKNAVDHVSLSVREGEIIAIVGESGSGKSTMLHAVLGLLPPKSGRKGRCFLFGRDTARIRKRQLQRMRGEQVSMIFQDTGRYLNPIARVGNQYDEFLKCHGIVSKAERRRLEEEQLRLVNLTDVGRILRSYPFELSGGMRQRVGIAMAMSLRPGLLLADEPTSALDVTVQAQVVREMAKLRDDYGTSIVIVTHNMGVAAHMSDRIGIMQSGRLIEYGKTDEVLRFPQKDYTKKLLDAVIDLNDERLIDAI